jgi:hypothetical protein
MAFASLVMPCLALRSTDTIETLVKTQQRYQSLASDAPDQANVIYSCANLQKKDNGLSGLMCEIKGTSLLNTTDLLTEQVFKGISVVKCNIDNLHAISIMQHSDEYTAKLHAFMADMEIARKNKAGMLLEQIMPTDEALDFWWWGQACEFKGGSGTKDCILHDGKRGDVVFYDAFTCISRTDNNTNKHETASDHSYRDACVWEPILHGSIGIYSQRAGDGNNIFLVCLSDFDQIASDIVRSMKADLGSSTNVYDFCSSKEMWFLENIALRNRLRLLLRVAEHLGITVPQKTDMFAHPKQTQSNLAIECCGISLDHIECHLRVDTLTHNTVAVVRHYKDCIDVTHRKGPIPVFLGGEQGILILLPEKASNLSFANHHDTVGYIQNKGDQQVHLCPTVNITELSRLNLQKIRAEQQNIVHMTMNDLLYDLQVQGLHIPVHVQELLLSTDEQGCSFFYGVHHGPNTPRLIYPRCIPAFIRDARNKDTVRKLLINKFPHSVASASMTTLLSQENSDICNVANMDSNHEVDASRDDMSHESRNTKHSRGAQLNAVANTSKKNTLPFSTTSSVPHASATTLRNHQNLAEMLCNVFAYTIAETRLQDGTMLEIPALFDFHSQQGVEDSERMSLEWNEATIELLQKITRMNHIDTLYLLPHITFSNSAQV